jgi:hypothetical protein
MKNSTLFLATIACAVICTSCTSQPSSPYAPEAGKYTGETVSLNATMRYGYDAITGFGLLPGTTVQIMPAVLGEMIITSSGANKGTYSFPKTKGWTGNWSYDPEKDKLSFTGNLKDALSYYHAGKGFYTIGITIRTNATGKEGVSYSYSKKASKEFPKLQKPNGNLTGTFTIKPDFNSIAFLDAQKSVIQKSFTGKLACTNSSHYTVAVGFSNDAYYNQITIFDPAGNAKVYSPEKIKSFNWEFHEYQLGVLNKDATKLALLGKTWNKIGSDYSYTPSYYAVGIFDLSGRQLGLLPIEYNKYVKPFFLDDGRLVYSPKDGGIAISDGTYSTSKIIYENPVNCFAVSPNGKTIAVSEGIHLYTINIDGTGKKQITCDGKPVAVDNADNMSDMCWSPDGKYIGIAFKKNLKYILVIIPLDGSNYSFVKDEYGEIFENANPAISWH